MIAQYLWMLGSLILVILGSIHLVFTFFRNKFSPRKPQLEEEMKIVSPILTRETTMWKAWVGFNGSHSAGVIFIGLINLYIALKYFTLFQADHLFFLANIGTIGFYIWLAKKYWFKVPLVGLIITLICFISAYLIIVA